MKPVVAIIILNYNNWKDTLDCLDSLDRVDYPNFFTIICDNASQDESEGRIREWLNNKDDHYHFIQNGLNLGFAGGNNPGIKYGIEHGADYVLLLNNDTVVQPNFIEPLVSAAESDTSIGMVGGKIYYYSRPDRIWAAGGGYISRFTGGSTHFGLNENDNKVNSLPRVLDYVTGCLLLVKKSVIESVGLMDESYFLYYEESDWAYRARVNGFKSFYAPDSKIAHKVSASVKEGSPTLKYYNARNHVYFVLKNYKGLFRFVAFSRLIIKACARVVYHTLRGKRDRALLYWTAFLDGWAGRMGEKNL